MGRLFHALGILFLAVSLSAPTLANTTKKKVTRTSNITVIAIDAGHGGKDPGAIGKHKGVKEKDVTLAISKELKALLDADPNFRAVLTRSGDYFIQLPQRTEIARKHKANYLVSIHADSSPTSNSMRGSSVWVLSNQRANDEMGKWLEDNEKQSELLGGAGSVLANNNERYLNQTVLDLQFSHAQKAGYELGRTVLKSLSNLTPLAKSAPQHASLSVLRSPDIPSILVEVGFLSTPSEEERLGTSAYRKQVARAIYNGLVNYRKRNPGSVGVTQVKQTVYEDAKEELKSDTKGNSKKAGTETAKKESAKTNKQDSKNSVKTAEKKAPQKSTNGIHTVQENETLYSISRLYNTTPEKLSQLNKIKNNQIRVGQKLKIK